MITLLFIAGIIAFIAFITVLMVDPVDPQEFDALVQGTPKPVSPAPVQAAKVTTPMPVTPVQVPAAVHPRPTRAQPAFYEHIASRPAVAKPVASRDNRSLYIVDLSGEDAQAR
jgi:hypothetical protein